MITDAEHYVEMQVVKASSDSADDGTVDFTVDGLPHGGGQITGDFFDDYALGDEVLFVTDLIDSGTSGAFAMDQLKVTIDDPTNFAVGDSVIIADGSASEQLTISAIDTDVNTLTFSSALTNSYGADAFVTILEGGRKFTFEDTDFTEVQAAQNAEVRLGGYPAASWIERETNVVSDLIPGLTITLNATSVDAAAATISVVADPEAVKEKIAAFVAAFNVVKTFLNMETSYNVDTEESGVLLGNYAANMVESMLSDILVSIAAGFEDGVDAYTHLGQVGVETLGRTDDESALGTLVIDDEVLSEALQDDFEAAVRLFAASFSGRSDSVYLTFYSASELLTTPGTYDVEVDFDGSGNITAGRMKLDSEATFRSATVSSPYVAGTTDNPESSLWVRASWDGVSTTQTATVYVRQGFTGQIADAIDELLDPTDGLLQNLDESYDEIIEQIDKRIETEEARLEVLERRLKGKYARLEQLLVELQGQSEWATALSNGV